MPVSILNSSATEGAMKTMNKRWLGGFAFLLVSALVAGSGPCGENAKRQPDQVNKGGKPA